jgi:uncharacterized membrane protein YfcA
MEQLLLVGLAGFCASMVDGALGMGFGPTSASILLASGFSPVASAAMVNLAKVATGVSAAVAHWRFRNTDHRLVVKLAVPGALGALIGVTILASVDGDVLKPVLAVLLLVVAVRILLRFSTALPTGQRNGVDGPPVFDERGTTAVAATGGVTNGLVGAWGPVVTPFLLHRGLPPRFAIGSVNTAEVAVAVVSAGSLLASVGGAGIEPATVVAILVGGVIASPIAAWLIRFLPARGLGVAVGALLLVTNLRALAEWADVGRLRWVGYVAVAAATGAAALRPRLSRAPVPALETV